MPTNQSPPKPSPRRGTISAIVAACLLVFAFVLTNVPGNPVVGPEVISDGKYGPHFHCGVDSMLHGWPFTFLRHDGFIRKTWHPCSPWEIGDNPRFAIGPLIANVAVWLVAAGLAFRLVRGRVSRHGWRFGMSHLLLVICAVSVCGAYLNYRVRAHQVQIRFLKQQQNYLEHAVWHPFGPNWLRTLTGPGYWEWGDLLAEAYINEEDDIRKLPGKGSIKALRFSPGDWTAMPNLDDFDQLIAIDLFMSRVDEPCLRTVAKCKSLEGLNLYETGVTDRGLQELRPLQNLKNLELAANEELTDAGLEPLKTLKSLKRLSLGGRSGITKEGVAQLRAALPDCEIEWSSPD